MSIDNYIPGPTRMSLNCTEAMLVYLTAPGQALDIMVGDIRVRSLVFDLNNDFEDAGEVFLSNLFARVEMEATS